MRGPRGLELSKHLSNLAVIDTLDVDLPDLTDMIVWPSWCWSFLRLDEWTGKLTFGALKTRFNERKVWRRKKDTRFFSIADNMQFSWNRATWGGCSGATTLLALNITARCLFWNCGSRLESWSSIKSGVNLRSSGSSSQLGSDQTPTLKTSEKHLIWPHLLDLDSIA